MLEQAQPARDVTYRLGSALHWFDQGRFLAEAGRVAKPDAWLVIHDHWFAGQMQGDDRFAQWAREVYLATYPSPPRDRSWRPPHDLGDWRHSGWERYDHPVAFTPDQLATYLLTQSNLQTVIESGDRTEEHLRSWLMAETTPFFPNGSTSVLMFGGFVACHRQPL